MKKCKTEREVYEHEADEQAQRTVDVQQAEGQQHAEQLGCLGNTCQEYLQNVGKAVYQYGSRDRPHWLFPLEVVDVSECILPVRGDIHC